MEQEQKEQKRLGTLQRKEQGETAEGDFWIYWLFNIHKIWIESNGKNLY